MASDEDLQVYCDEEGTRLPAHGYCTDCKEHICHTCFKAHQINRLSKQHTLLDATSMPKVLQQPSTSIHTGLSDDLTLPCRKHPKEMIKFYCNDHTEFLCSVCVTLEHQATSCNVNYIPDISGDIIDSKEYQVIFKARNNTSDKCQQILNDFLKEALVDIKKFRQEINQRLDELERQVENASKVIEQKKQQQTSESNERPWDITTVASTELAVILPYLQTIQFISIFSNKLIKKHTVKVDGNCNGISYYQGKLIVSFLNPTKLQILDVNGTVLTTIDRKNIFKDPCFIICNRSSIYVSDCSMKTVTRLNWQGDMVGSYNCIRMPSGMSLSDDGTVFVCCQERNVIEDIS
ncbi:E3 ubiquitin-protein ligase TRIM33-like [Ruditapes philippinarum]|uniref:E3 ubiquitin-protein ligase TRIM33-like n=1 Tax=Ruditapes philippinarum TaxID=129788 RepID=UPI00295C125B|nr:E3 ubiquitin-protein ligase TRIM33-like [Ruditapes philippinarum]